MKRVKPYKSFTVIFMKYIALLLILFVSCKSAKQLANQRYIEGNWCLVERGKIHEVNYEQIQFNSNHGITLLSRADTIYFYEYRVKKNNLLIIRNVNNDTISSHILKLSSDSLILSSLLEKKIPQVYYRCK